MSEAYTWICVVASAVLLVIGLLLAHTSHFTSPRGWVGVFLVFLGPGGGVYIMSRQAPDWLVLVQGTIALVMMWVVLVPHKRLPELREWCVTDRSDLP